MVPHLATALTGPINELEQHMLDSTPAIERWFRLEWMEHTPVFYASILVHNAGYKLAPTITNLFPDSWQLLSQDLMQLAVQAAMAAIEKICPEAHNLLIIPDDRLDNPHYLSSLERMAEIMHLVGLHVRFASLDPRLTQPQTIALPSGKDLYLEPLERNGYRVGVRNFDPCTILLNNSLRGGIPGILEDLREQFLLPPLQAGWSIRRKSNHARCYEDLAKRFGKFLGIDHWLVAPIISRCAHVPMNKPSGQQPLEACVEALLTKIRRKYKEYGITDKPCVTIQSDSGIALDGIALVSDPKEIRQALAASSLPKAGHTDLLVQESIPTSEYIENAAAAPVVYTIDRYVVGGYYRALHTAPGIPLLDNCACTTLYPLIFDASAQQPSAAMKGKKPSHQPAPNRFYMYGVIARLSILAASYEMEATMDQVESEG